MILQYRLTTLYPMHLCYSDKESRKDRVPIDILSITIELHRYTLQHIAIHNPVVNILCEIRIQPYKNPF